MRRFTRLTNGFSKKFENHMWMVALYAVYYNFLKTHKTLRVTPAMEAGLTDRIWTFEGYCWADRRERPEAGTTRTIQEADFKLMHYRFSGYFRVRVPMTDKGPYHSYEMGGEPSRGPADCPTLSHPTMCVERSGTTRLPALLAPDPAAERCVMEFFTAHIRKPHTRKAYARASARFAACAEGCGIAHLRQVEPVHVAAYIEELQGRMAAPSVKLHLAGIRMLFDWLVVGQVLPTNPASAGRGPKHSVKKGKTPVLTAAEARDLLDSIVTDTLPGLLDHALIALMIYTFARVGAVLKMRTEDVCPASIEIALSDN